MKLTGSLKRIIKNHRYNYAQMKDERIAFNRLSDELKNNLTDETKKEIEQYCKLRFGSTRYKYSLFLYSAINGGVFKEGWTPQLYYKSVLLPKLNHSYRSAGLVKSLNAKLIENDYFPDKYYYVNGLWYDTQYRAVPFSEIIDYLTNKEKSMFFKLDNTNQGKGVHKIDANSIRGFDFKSLGNGVLQSGVIQHPSFDKFVTDNVCTLRVTSYLDNNGKVHILTAYAKLGQSGYTHIISGTSVRISIDEQGYLFPYGYDHHWNKYYEHPETKESFKGFKVPEIDKVYAIVKDLHTKLPHFKINGWDIAIDSKSNVKILEYNTNQPAIIFSEVSNGPHYQLLMDETR